MRSHVRSCVWRIKCGHGLKTHVVAPPRRREAVGFVLVIAFPLHNPCKKLASFSKRVYCLFRPHSAKERVPAPAVFQSK
jgi:hypothetical protein